MRINHALLPRATTLVMAIVLPILAYTKFTDFQKIMSGLAIMFACWGLISCLPANQEAFAPRRP